MEQITIDVYSFNELSEEAQEKAIENSRYSEVEHFDWWGASFDQFADLAEMFGLDIRQTPKYGYARPAIYFSGFSSQGDGACFEGFYQYKKGALKKIKKEWPEDEELHQIVASLQELQRKNFYRITCHTKQHGHYNHSGCMNVDVENSFDSYLDVQGEDDFIQCMRNFADWIYKRLEEEHDYLTSDECIKERLGDGDYQFTEDGENF